MKLCVCVCEVEEGLLHVSQSDSSNYVNSGTANIRQQLQRKGLRVTPLVVGTRAYLVRRWGFGGACSDVTRCRRLCRCLALA